MTADSIYERLVGEEGLYGHAFFGWKATPKQEAALARLWKRARTEATAGIHA